MNLVRNLIWSATRVAPWVRTCANFCVAAAVDDVVGFCRLVERLRVWENAVEGVRSNNVSKVVAMGFKVVFSSAAVLNFNRYFLG